MVKPLPDIPLKSLKRFCERISIPESKTPSKKCWLWIGETIQGKGYGIFWCGSRQYLAHRLAYLLHFKADPGEMLVCHKCDNPKCVNPNHFFLGTHADNHKDMRAKGRHPQLGPRGEAHPKATLKNHQVIEIRALAESGMSDRKIADLFKINHATVYQVRKRITWRHV